MALLVVVFVAAMFVAAFAVPVIAKHVPSLRGMAIRDLLQVPEVAIGIEWWAQAALLVFMLLLVSVHYRRPFLASVRWKFPRARWGVFLVLGFAMALALAPFETGLEKVAPSPKQLPIEQMFKTTTAAYVMALFGTLWAPFIEEMFFRGFLYPVLARQAGSFFAIVITALFFAFVHGAQLADAVAPLVIIFIVGLVLTTVRSRTKSVGSSMLVHMGYNAALFLMAWHASDHFRHLEKLQ